MILMCSLAPFSIKVISDFIEKYVAAYKGGQRTSTRQASSKAREG